VGRGFGSGDSTLRVERSSAADNGKERGGHCTNQSWAFIHMAFRRANGRVENEKGGSKRGKRPSICRLLKRNARVARDPQCDLIYWARCKRREKGGGGNWAAGGKGQPRLRRWKGKPENKGLFNLASNVVKGMEEGGKKTERRFSTGLSQENSVETAGGGGGGEFQKGKSE